MADPDRASKWKALIEYAMERGALVVDTVVDEVGICGTV